MVVRQPAVGSLPPGRRRGQDLVVRRDSRVEVGGAGCDFLGWQDVVQGQVGGRQRNSTRIGHAEGVAWLQLVLVEATFLLLLVFARS